MYSSISRAQTLARKLVTLEPRLSGQEETLATYLDTEIAGDTPPPSLLSARRAATAALFLRRGGLEAWNARAQLGVALLREAGLERPLVSRLHEILAADFTEVSSPGELNLSGAIFPGHLVLDRATIAGHLRLDGATVMAAVHGRGLRVERNLTAEQTTFVGPVSIERSEIAGASRFSYADFASTVGFDGCTFRHELWLRSAKFAGRVHIRAATLHYDASLGCDYGDDVDLQGTRFSDTVSFEGADVKGDMILSHARFEGILHLTGMRIRGAALLNGTHFSDRVRPNLDVLTEAAKRAPRASLGRGG